MKEPQDNLIHLTDEDFRVLSGFMRERYGIDLSKKRVLIEGRLTQELRRRRIDSFSAYIKIVFSDKTGNEAVNLLNKLTTNLSYFMREQKHFEFMKNTVLPAFRPSGGRGIRIWSAGCSSGQEPYNIAMMCEEHFGKSSPHFRDQSIFACDISDRMLKKASEGVYSGDELADIPPKWKSEFFTALGGGQYRVIERIRKKIVFRPFNLMEPFRFRAPFDMIFCRNVMIYFDQPTKNSIVSKFFDWTERNGFLFIGHSESLGRDLCGYTYIQPAIYQKKG